MIIHQGVLLWWSDCGNIRCICAFCRSLWLSPLTHSDLHDMIWSYQDSFYHYWYVSCAENASVNVLSLLAQHRERFFLIFNHIFLQWSRRSHGHVPLKTYCITVLRNRNLFVLCLLIRFIIYGLMKWFMGSTVTGSQSNRTIINQDR